MTSADNPHIEPYLHHLRFERRLSENTCSAYERDIRRFAEFSEQHSVVSFLDVTPALVRLYAGSLFRKGLSGRSIRRELSALRGLYTYLIREGIAQANPALGISAPKSNHILPEFLDIEQIARLLTIAPDSVLAIRDRAILELFYSSGLRLSELANLVITDIDWGQASVRVLGKGNKMRVVPVGRMAMSALREWLKARVKCGVLATETSLFVGQSGRSLGVRAIQLRVDHWAKKMGLDSNVHPHMFRHSFASHLLESSGDLRAVQELLGHVDISSTQIYTHLDFQHLADVYEKAHPRASRTKGKQASQDKGS